MKRLFLCAIPFALLIGIGAYNAEPSGSEIRIYSTDADIHPVVARLNRRLAREGLTILVVDVANDADVRVKFVDVAAGDPTNGGASWPYDGRIEIARDDNEDLATTLLHEMLHCAGVGHEYDPTSVMYRESGARRQLRPHHVSALRRLPGITTPGRFIAQLRTFFY
jgi:hypothetical protein